MEVWIGPAIVAAIVAALVNVAGWIVTFRQSRAMEQLRREEKVHDFQVALQAEIRSDILSMAVFDRSQLLTQVKQRYAEEPGYSVLVPHLASNAIFDSVVDDIHILPGEIIGAIVDYERLRQTLTKFAGDLRAPSFALLGASRQTAMYTDYLDTSSRVEALARRALTALELSLSVSSPDVVQSSPPSAAGPVGLATVSGQGEP